MAWRSSPAIGYLRAAVFAAAAGVAVVAHAGPLGGDGSGTNNSHLLRGSVDAGCSDPDLCQIDWSALSAEEVHSAPPSHDGRPALAPVACADAKGSDFGMPCGAGVPAGPPVAFKPYDPNEITPSPVEMDWALSLRGSYVADADGQRYEASAIPTLSLSYEGSRTQWQLSSTAATIVESDGSYRLSSAALSFAGDYLVGRNTVLGASGGLEISQDSVHAAGLAGDVAVPPTEFSGDGDISLSHQFARVGVELHGVVLRNAYSATGLTDGSWRDNSGRNRSGIGGNARVAVELTPITTAFGEVSTRYDIYDAPSSSLGAYLNGWTHQLRGGLRGSWDGVWLAEAGVGYALRQFDDSALSGAGGVTYDAALTFTPDETLEVTGRFATDVGPSTSSVTATTRFGYSAEAEVAYRVSKWIALRASIGARWARFAGSSERETGYSAGLGADFDINRHTTFSADYSYGYSEITPGPVEQSHRVGLGVTFSR